MSSTLSITDRARRNRLQENNPIERPTLLIVDDEEGPRKSLRLVFKDHYDLLLASSGAEALALAGTHTVDVAVLDVRMAEMDGMEVLRRLKRVDPGIEVVIMTAFETAETLREAIRLQACDYINKPFDVVTMRAAVSKALRRRTLATEVRRNEERTRQLQQELEERVVLDGITRDQGEIYASVIHDINSPLTVISALIQSMNEEMGEAEILAGDELDMARDRLKRITRQVTNCVDVSRRYLGLLRQRPGDRPKVWVNQILSDLRELLSAYPYGAHQLLVHPLREDVEVPIHGTDLTQILRNLVLNALQCSPRQHRVEIRGQVMQGPLDLSHFVDGPEDRFINREGFANGSPLLALSVQDGGPGIAAEVLPRVFEPFFTTSQTERGTGLGLCIVQRLLREASGGLHVRTRVGQGTIFTIYLPLQR